MTDAQDAKVSPNDDKSKVKAFEAPPVKTFMVKESPLTDLWASNPDMQSAFNMIGALVVLLAMATVTTYVIDNQQLQDDIEYFNWAFRNFHAWWLVWGLTKLSAIIPYKLVANYNLNRDANYSSFRNAYIVYYLALFFVPINAMLFIDFSIVLKFAFLMEQVRIMMKIHSFVAETTWMTTPEKMSSLEGRHLLYFLFAPTFIFRLSYPRKSQIDWKRAAAYAIQFFLATSVSFLTLPAFCQRNFGRFGHEPFGRKAFIQAVLISTLMGAQCLFSVFYGILHCWLNMWAELLTFADRRFYDKWWLLDAYSRYYREWNLVVYDWLYNYVYRDVVIMTKGNRAFAATAVFLMSAIFHEYIITLALGNYYPVLFVLFAGIGMFVYFFSLQFKRTSSPKFYGNIFLFFSIFLGWSLQIVLYALEYYSRINCPQTKGWLYDKMVPRSWNC